MKIRSGFVSNSSSSSFLIYGTVVDQSNIPEDCDGYDYLEEKLKDSDMVIHSPSNYDCYYIGKSWETIGDDETGKQFKDRIEKVLKEKLGNDIKCYTCSQAWYD